MENLGYRVGQRVQLHPATDWWMRGARFGEIVKLGKKYLHVKLGVNTRTIRVLPENILERV